MSGGFLFFRSPPLDRLGAMAAIAPQPVVVDSPAGAPSSGSPIFLTANSEVVSSTPCLDWQPAPAGPGGAARVQLLTFQAVKAFLPRCKISRIAADLTAANAVNVLTVRLTDACWSRVLTELSAAQVFAETSNAIEELHSFLQDANIPTPPPISIWWRGIGATRKLSPFRAGGAPPLPPRARCSTPSGYRASSPRLPSKTPLPRSRRGCSAPSSALSGPASHRRLVASKPRRYS